MLSVYPLRRPLVGIALSMVLGIYVASHIPVPSLLFLFFAVSATLAAALLLQRTVSEWLLFFVVASIAGMHYQLSGGQRSARSIIHQFDALPLRNVEVLGRVSGVPRYYAFDRAPQGMWIFPVTLEGLKTADVWMTQKGEIDVRVMGVPAEEPSAGQGQRVWLKGTLQQRNYRSGNPVGLKVHAGRFCQVLSGPRFSFLSWCQMWRNAAGRRLQEGIADKSRQLAILRSLVLGYRNEIPAGTYACFQRTGSLHVFAISGLHVGIIGLLLVIILKTLGVPRDWFGVWLVPLLLVYVAATGMKASALRATVMAAVFLLAPLFRRKPDIPSSVAFAAVLLLALNPEELDSAGFVFSFVVVAFIVMVYSVIPERWMVGGAFRRYGVSLVITSCAASLASMPVTAYYFGRLSPIALVGNLVVVPLTFCTVLSGWLSILFPWASAVFNHASVLFINIMLTGISWLDRIPGSSFEVEAPPAAALVLWYGSLILLLVHVRTRRRRIVLVSMALCALVWMFY